ncbi:hypothetical protein P153DRAFT_154059 [Dothidotthia symphoricarpi CBS 119687]|uniref:Uncharacterized protein n=1 Tax=Dothidotthia symphoricarpi CBS 119687 TaxID=1392245 RepID=A0A6A6AMU5_9PLEO|nr:uncharacterized protein P153DRAFT_154059 [Dothidotthia symphoricarpi CBS 119687]KAF2133302.1 hypothetical protein P153DRAFT_154059 [Dothidotthia symphoricarpi CBS 119687]
MLSLGRRSWCLRHDIGFCVIQLLNGFFAEAGRSAARPMRTWLCLFHASMISGASTPPIVGEEGTTKRKVWSIYVN